jgi:hypothetical protein
MLFSAVELLPQSCHIAFFHAISAPTVCGLGDLRNHGRARLQTSPNIAPVLATLILSLVGREMNGNQTFSLIFAAPTSDLYLDLMVDLIWK